MVALSNIVIAGGGIIGNSISYYLAKNHKLKTTIIDPVGISPAASGKAGGFLAKSWSDHSCLSALQRRSFDLHAELAEELGAGTIDYRRLTAAAVAVDSSSLNIKSKKLEGVEWADLNVLGYQNLGDEDDIAQVHPRKLCHAMWEYCQTSVNSALCVDKVKNTILNEKNEVISVELQSGKTIDNVDVFIIACGPWTNDAKNWFPKKDSTLSSSIPTITGIKYHSMLVQSPTVLNQAVFFQGAGDPEFYPRPDSDVYITGFPDAPTIVTEQPSKEEVRSDCIQKLAAATSHVSSTLSDIQPHTTQACYLPSTNDGIPIIGKLTNIENSYVATGHTCWGN